MADFIASKKLRLVMEDKWGGLYRDPQGYGYRPPTYRPRYLAVQEAMKATGSVHHWMALTNGWFSTTKRKSPALWKQLKTAAEQILSPSVVWGTPYAILGLAALYVFVKAGGVKQIRD